MSWSPSQVPQVFVSQKPAELILVQGGPQLEAIPGTSLSWVTNSDSDIFYYAPTAQWYFLVSGRWFSAATLGTGPWTYATPSLPADFANIPSDSPRAAVLSSVPGTPEANEAVAQAQMPHKADVNIATTTVNVVYGGPPQFTPISGTTMQYATNTSYQVIQASGNYYVCSNGVWFVSQSPNGPFAVATVVPQVIYTIPPSSPMYNVTYVQVYDVTPTTVTVGYTSGYNGAYVAAGVVMLGVGMAMAYSYHPYYPPGFGYPVYYHPPYPYTGYGYHAAYNPYTGAYAHGYSAYGPYGGASAGAGYNPSTGTYARGASATGPVWLGGCSAGLQPAHRCQRRVPTSIPMRTARTGPRSIQRTGRPPRPAIHPMPTARPPPLSPPREGRRQASQRPTAPPRRARRQTATSTRRTTATSTRTPAADGSRAAAAAGARRTSRREDVERRRPRAVRRPRRRRLPAPGRAAAAASTAVAAAAATVAGTAVVVVVAAAVAES